MANLGDFGLILLIIDYSMFRVNWCSNKVVYCRPFHRLTDSQREVVLLELSKKRESFADLAPILWHSTGTVAALLQEIVSIYSLLTPPTLTAHASNRVCNALALLQCVASHADTRQPFLAANMYVRYVFCFGATTSGHYIEEAY